MKVAYLFSRYPVPSQTFCDTEMRALEALGFEIEIFSCSPPTTSFRHGADSRPRAPVFYAPPGTGLEWHEVAARREQHWPAAMVAEHVERFGGRHGPPAKGMLETTRRAQHAIFFADLLQQRGIEHLHVHFANRATHAALFIHALTGLPFSFTAHAQDFLVDLRSDALLAELCAQARFVVAVSEWSRRALIERCPESAPKIHRIYNGLPLDRWPATGPMNEVGERELRIFSVGRLVGFKGFDTLIDACAALKARGVLFRCEIAGEGHLESALRQQIERANVGDRVQLIGLQPQAEIHARLAACDVFALACRVEANGACDVLPTVILEAMAAGRPVVSTRVAGVPEMVIDGQTGRLVGRDDAPALADALAGLAQDRDARERMGRAGRRKLESDFGSAASAAQLSALLTDSRGKTSAVAPAVISARTICLFDLWPGGSHNGRDGALLAWQTDDPTLRIIALKAGAAPPILDAVSPETFALVPVVAFLPDAMVVEGEWRERAADAHRIETWRDALGGGPGETDEFLLAARRALHLHNHWRGIGLAARHLHAVGPRALRCAAILKWLGVARAVSFCLGPGGVSGVEGMPGSTLRRLADQFAGGWVAGERKLVARLGPTFRGDDAPASPADWQRWAEWVRSLS